ncbi:MAG: glycine reductase, partial [Pseudomonadota bacterium]|nr:glycine reductase [Pseudomonadota bacterium]
KNEIGALAPFIYGFPTNRSQRTNREQDCPELVSQLLADEVDSLILVPNCPVCHQSLALAARAAEKAGLLTVIMGCAKDIVERVGVPRFYFSDFPLGNSCGRPDDRLSQEQMLNDALYMLETAIAPRTTVTNLLKWQGVKNWKDDYANIEKLSDAEIAQRRADFDAAKTVLKKERV